MKKKLFSDLTAKIDRNGRIRIGGKFASKIQLSRWVAARRRRGLAIPIIERKQPASKNRSVSAMRAAATKAANSDGSFFLREQATKLNRIRYRYWNLSSPTVESIRLVIKRETIGLKRGVFVYPVVELLDEDDDEFYASINKGFFRDEFSDSTHKNL